MSEAAEDPHAAAWRAATSFAELCELGAAFLRAELDFFPGWLAQETDEETDALVPDLLRLTAEGVLPLASQPGEPRAAGHDGRLWSRRAFLNGFASPQAEARCRRRVVAAGLCWRSFPASAVGAVREPVGLRGGEPFLLAGQAAGGLELELFAPDLHPTALAALERTRYFSCFDPVWGRPRALFDALGGRGG